MTWAAYPRLAAEIMRLCPLASRAGAVVVVTLQDAATAGRRVRGSARYLVRVAFSWRADLGAVVIVEPLNGAEVVSIHIRHCWRMNSFPCNSMFPKQKSMHFRELVVHWVMIADS